MSVNLAQPAMCCQYYFSSFPGAMQAVNEFVIGSSAYKDVFQVKDLLVAKKKGGAAC